MVPFGVGHLLGGRTLTFSSKFPNFGVGIQHQIGVAKCGHETAALILAWRETAAYISALEFNTNLGAKFRLRNRRKERGAKTYRRRAKPPPNLELPRRGNLPPFTFWRIMSKD